MAVVKIIESPRDAWQGLPKQMSPEVKAEYLRALVVAGFTHIDAVSFVSKEAVPQMADSELVLEYLDAPEDVEIIGLVANAKGAERAVESGRVTTIAFPYSISPQFLERNQRQTPEEALDQLEQIGELAYKGGQDVVAYLAMAFGNPFGDAWDIDEVVSAVDLLVDSGVAQVVLADTAGTATASQLDSVLACVLGVHSELEVGVHLHARRENAAELIRAAYMAGCRRFDSTLGGVGSVPAALIGVQPDALIGNLPTELLLETLKSLGATLPDMESVDRLIVTSRELERKYGVAVQ
jgi:hydroxymethylglutaryl-CoA lyase